MNSTELPSIRLTTNAINAAKALRLDLKDDNKQSLRLYISGKGCSGFEYGISFDAAEPDDQRFYFDDITVVVDSRTMLFCRGIEVDWVDDDRGRGFLITNPNQRHFRGKFFKRRIWQETLNELKDR